MSKIRIFFDVASLISSCTQIAIYECANRDDMGVLIDTQPVKVGFDYIETDKATDPFKWFLLEMRDEFGGTLDLAENPVLAEDTQGKIFYIRKELKDTSMEDPAFTDDELISKVRMGALRLNKSKNLSEMPENYWPIVSVLVRIDCCYVIAYDYAKYTKLEIPGGSSLSRDELYKHYLEIARQLEEYYAKIKGELDKYEEADKFTTDAPIATVTISDMEYEG